MDFHSFSLKTGWSNTDFLKGSGNFWYLILISTNSYTYVVAKSFYSDVTLNFLHDVVSCEIAIFVSKQPPLKILNWNMRHLLICLDVVWTIQLQSWQRLQSFPFIIFLSVFFSAKHGAIGLHSSVPLLCFLKWQLCHHPQFRIETKVITKSIFSNRHLATCTVFALFKCNEITFKFSATLLSATRPLV